MMPPLVCILFNIFSNRFSFPKCPRLIGGTGVMQDSNNIEVGIKFLHLFIGYNSRVDIMVKKT